MRLAIVSAGALVAVLSAHPARAADSVEDVAAEAGVNPKLLEEAAEVTGMDAREYLMAVGELARPVPINPRVECIEMKESGGANVWRGNTPPVYGDKPAGVLQYFELTFRRGAIEMGHPEWDRWIPWQARQVASHDLAMGRRTQWTVSGC